jgi:hypothetical protein
MMLFRDFGSIRILSVKWLYKNQLALKFFTAQILRRRTAGNKKELLVFPRSSFKYPFSTHIFSFTVCVGDRLTSRKGKLIRPELKRFREVFSLIQLKRQQFHRIQKASRPEQLRRKV